MFSSIRRASINSLVLFRLDLMFVQGKRGNKVPIIMTQDIVIAITILIVLRERVGIPPSNPFIFAAPTRNSLSHLRGNDALSITLEECPGLKCPESIKSTKLRKYVATVSQIIHMEGNELEWLAAHLGHNINVHKKYYRLSDSTIELAKVSKLLLAIDEGNGAKFVGKTLDEITLEGNGQCFHFSISIR